MKSVFVILFLLSAVELEAWRPRTPFLGRFARSRSQKNAGAAQFETRYFRQRLDHFSFADLPDFNHRYLVGGADGRWAPPDPIFFYCGNEGDIEWFSDNTGFVWEIAPRFSAFVVFAEVVFFLNFCYSAPIVRG